MTTASKFASALDDVPSLLLDAEHRRARETARATLQVLGTVDVDTTALVVIGGGGSGKSSVVNALVGSEVAAVSVVRPTTVAVAEYVYANRLRDGIMVIDTPSWDHEREAVLEVVADAHTVVAVLTPARYGDAVSIEMIRALPDRTRVTIVANRMPADPDENDEVLDDIESTFGRQIDTQIVEGASIELPDSLMDDLPVDTESLETKRSHERSAANLGRMIARGVSSEASHLATVERVLTEMEPGSSDQDLACVNDDWSETRTALIESAANAIVSFDGEIVVTSDNDLAVRLRDNLGAPAGSDLEVALDAWHSDTAEAFSKVARPRWRRKATLDLIDGWSWMLCLDTRVTPPRRVSRAMHGTLDATTANARARLLSILHAGVQHRPALWRDAISEAGSYRPGELFAASDELDGGEPLNG